jgi:hypothetical protein
MNEMNEATLEAWAEYAAELESQFLADYNREMSCDCEACVPVSLPRCQEATFGCECKSCRSFQDRLGHVRVLNKGDKQYEDAPRKRRVPTAPRRARSQRRERELAER